MSRSAVSRRGPLVMAIGFLLAVALIASGCGDSDDDSGGGGSQIALLLPENETPRYESDDRPDFEAAVEELCPDCEVIYLNAGGDAEKQQSQAESALTQGAEVMVVDPMDSKSAAAIAEKSQAQGVPVVSYDRLIENPQAFYLTFDNKEVGRLQAKAVYAVAPKGNYVFIKGSSTDPNADFLFAGEQEDFFLNLAVYKFEDMIREVGGADYPIRFEYGRPKKGHNWHHKDWAGVVREMAEHVRKTAPAGEDVSGWNY